MKNFKKILMLISTLISLCWGSIRNLQINENEKIIIFAPHPDDEILGCGGLIQKVIKKKGEVYIVYLTNGDHNQLPYRIYEKKIILNPSDYIKLGEIRKKESIKATKILGVSENNLIFLGYPDFGILKIWENYWGENKKPFRSFLTKASYVPYKENYSFGKPYKGESILEDIKKIINEIRPSKIFITSPFDTNVDHRALYNFVRASLLEIEGLNPEVYIYLIHFRNYPLKNSEKLFLPEIFLLFKTYIVPLSNEEVKKKKISLECFTSQMMFRKKWFFSFVKKNEIFYTKNDLILTKNLVFESEKEAEFENYKNLSYPFYINLIKDDEFLKIEFIHKIKILGPTEYVFYFFPFKKNIEFSKMPKLKINLKRKNEFITSVNSNFYKDLKYEKLKDKVSFKIKISELKYPEYLFFSSNIKIGGINYDFIPWEVIKVEY